MKDAASITTGMRLEAKRLCIKPNELGGGNLRDAAAIDLAIGRAVKAERERCVLCVICAEVSHLSQTNEQMCRSIIRKINQAKRPSRKRK